MSKIRARAGLEMRLGLEQKANTSKFTQFDSVTPSHVIEIEQEVPSNWTDEQVIERADKLHQVARALVEKKMNQDIKEAKSPEA